MQPWVIDLNDAGIVVCDGNAVLATSPGYATALPNELLVGASAFANSCVYPRQTVNTFWSQFDTTPLRVPGAPTRSAAEYIHAHLNEVVLAAGGAPQQPAILLTPAQTSRDQLALLLGIAAQCQFNAVGLVDSAVAAAVSAGLTDGCLYLDVNLHCATVSYMQHTDEHFERTSSETIATVGWVTTRARMVQTLCEAFVAQTRFDPHRHAAAEEQLHAYLEALLTGRYDYEGGALLGIACNHGAIEHRIALSPDSLVLPLRENQLHLLAAAQRVAPRGTPLLLSAHAARVPGLADVLASLGNVYAVSELGLARTVLAHQERIVHSEAAALPFIRRLPSRSKTSIDTTPQVLRNQRGGTRQQFFAMHNNTLRSVSEKPLHITVGMPGEKRNLDLATGAAQEVGVLVTRGDQLRLVVNDGVSATLNNAAVRGTVTLSTGDVLALPGTTATITIVELATVELAQAEAETQRADKG